MKVDRFTKTVALLNCAVPAALLGWDALDGRLGANPVNFAIKTTGSLALIFLILSLAVTPAIKLTGLGWLGQFRRLLGLAGFFHACLHFFLFFEFDRAADVVDTISEVWKRPYLMVGMLGLVLMVPLAATSTDGMIRRLGPGRWKALHRLAYVAAAAGAVHFYMQVKADTARPLAFGGVLGALLLFRVVAYSLKARAAPQALANARPRPWTGKLRVIEVVDETHEVRTFRLGSIGGGPLPFRFLPGQYLNLALDIDGVKVRRSYTIASTPSRTASCDLTVKREDGGLASKHLHNTIKPGALLDVVAPSGRFTFDGTDADGVVLIAGGVGITPLMSKIRYLADVDWPGPIDLIYSARAARDVIFRDELAALSVRHPNLRVAITLTREPGDDWRGERGRIDADLIRRAVPDIGSKRVDICGPTEMVGPIRAILGELGVPDSSIFVESFTSPGRAPSSPGGIPGASSPLEGEPSVEFARSGKSSPSPLPKGRTILEAAEALGVAIDYDCRAGICGTCKVALVSGSVAMDSEDALTEADRAASLILSCQAHCLDRVVVDA